MREPAELSSRADACPEHKFVRGDARGLSVLGSYSVDPFLERFSPSFFEFGIPFRVMLGERLDQG